VPDKTNRLIDLAMIPGRNPYALQKVFQSQEEEKALALIRKSRHFGRFDASEQQTGPDRKASITRTDHEADKTSRRSDKTPTT